MHFQDLGHSFSLYGPPTGQYHKYINGRSHPALFLYFTIPEAKKLYMAIGEANGNSSTFTIK